MVRVPGRYVEFGDSIHPWTIETLFHQYLLTPYARDKLDKSLVCGEFDTLARLLDCINAIEDAEADIYLRKMDVLDELTRIAYRQFHWQRGYLNVANYYRSAYIFGQGECSTRFAGAYGLSINEFSLAGFALVSQANKPPGIPRSQRFDMLDLRPEAYELALQRLAAPIAELRRLAAQRHVSRLPVAYQPSVLREYPLVAFEPGFVVPVPALIQLRTTSGIYYDLVGLGGGIKEEIGRRFENYSLEFLQKMMGGDLDISAAVRYGRKGHMQDSPDILVRKNQALELIVECKSKKLSFEDQYGSDRWSSHGFAELVKGVQQIWKFASDVRRGLVLNERTAPQLHGAVLTLDSWGQMSRDALNVALERAAVNCTQMEGFEECDTIPVALCSIEELESAAEHATPNNLLQAVKIAGTKKWNERMLSHVLKENELWSSEARAYPFKDRIGEVLPWWKSFPTGDRAETDPMAANVK